MKALSALRVYIYGRWFTRLQRTRRHSREVVLITLHPACCSTATIVSAGTALKTFSMKDDVRDISPQDETSKFDPEAVPGPSWGSSSRKNLNRQNQMVRLLGLGVARQKNNRCLISV